MEIPIFLKPLDTEVTLLRVAVENPSPSYSRHMGPRYLILPHIVGLVINTTSTVIYLRPGRHTWPVSERETLDERERRGRERSDAITSTSTTCYRNMNLRCACHHQLDGLGPRQQRHAGDEHAGRHDRDHQPTGQTADDVAGDDGSQDEDDHERREDCASQQVGEVVVVDVDEAIPGDVVASGLLLVTGKEGTAKQKTR